MIKMIVSDMDGTLLTGKKGLSEKTVQTLLEAIASGIEFVAATGRDLSGVKGIFDQYGIPFSAILGNGAQYIDRQGQLLKTAYFPKQRFKAVIDVFDQLQIHYMIFAEHGFYATAQPEEVAEAFIKRGMHHFHKTRQEVMAGWDKTAMPCMQLIQIHDVDQFLQQPLEIIKVEAFDIDEAKISQAKEQLAHIPDIAYLSSFSDNVEVTDQKAQKGLILEEVIKDLGIRKDEVAVYGDGLNDLTLFTHFPHSFAVANADPEIKKIAAYQILSNEEDGVAKSIVSILKAESADH